MQRGVSCPGRCIWEVSRCFGEDTGPSGARPAPSWAPLLPCGLRSYLSLRSCLSWMQIYAAKSEH